MFFKKWMYLSLYFSTTKNHTLGFVIIIDFLPPMLFSPLSSPGLGSPRIHSRIAKCWLTNYSFILILELPGLVHVMRSSRKTIPKMKLTQNGAPHMLLHSCPPTCPASHCLSGCGCLLWSQASPCERWRFQWFLLLTF